MNIFRILILCFGIFTIISCKKDSKTSGMDGQDQSKTGQVSTIDSTQPALFNEIMAVHDEIMPQMNEIETLKQDIRMRMDSIDAQNDKAEFRSQFRHALAELNRADNMMSDWMNNFKENYDTIKLESIKNSFLEAERAKIEGVKMTMDESIKVARLTISNTPVK